MVSVGAELSGSTADVRVYQAGRPSAGSVDQQSVGGGATLRDPSVREVPLLFQEPNRWYILRGALLGHMRKQFGHVFAEHPGRTFSPIASPVKIGGTVYYSGQMLPADFPVLGRKLGELVARDLEVEEVDSVLVLKK